MPIRLTNEERSYIAQFEAESGVPAIDCLIEDEAVTFVVPPTAMADAIGPDGRTVAAIEERLGRDVALVEDAEYPEHFVANALAPAAVYEVTLGETDDGTIATAAVDERDMGVAIGADGHRIERARRLADRHFDIVDVDLEAVDPAKDDA